MENVLHIFLDTNILENDPFLQQVVNLKLLVKHGKAEILLPDVVIDELIKHTIKKTKEAINRAARIATTTTFITFVIIKSSFYHT